MPHDVVNAYRRCPSASVNSIPNPFAKFCPRLWLVQDCSALPSRISASIV
jgi:hypothetical protein